MCVRFCNIPSSQIMLYVCWVRNLFVTIKPSTHTHTLHARNAPNNAIYTQHRPNAISGTQQLRFCVRADICVVLNCKTYTAPPFLPPTPPHLERTECRGYCPVLVCERNVFTPNENWDGPHRRTPAYCVACIKSRMELSKLLACMRPVPCQKFEC